MTDLWAETKRTPTFENVDAARFRDEIQPRNQPAILKGLARAWPAIGKAQDGPQALADYLARFSSDKPIEAYIGASDIAGRFTYGEDFKSFNFEKRAMTFRQLLDLLLAHKDDLSAPHLYAGAVNLPEHLPGLIAEAPLDLVAPQFDRLVSLWIGNRSRTAAHWDLPQNIACVIAGQRRYTLFPTNQIANLYVGPLDFTLAGRPTSLVDFRDPDFARFPNFREAMAHAEIADLEPGDAIYVPSLWFHHVESDGALAAMVNFWWREAPAHMLTPFLTMLHALLTLKDLPAHERENWRVIFDHYIFRLEGEPMEHLPAEARGVFGKLTPEKIADLKAYLMRTLSR